MKTKLGTEPRYQIYAPKGCLTPQLRDTHTPLHEIVLVAPTIGGQWMTKQSVGQGVRLLQKVAKMLNAS